MDDEQDLLSRLVALRRSGSLSRSELPDLLRLAQQEQGRTSSVAVHLIGTLGSGGVDAVALLVNLLQAHRNDAFGRTVARALGAIGPAALAAVPELRAARRSDNKRVRRAARAALEKIEST
jgi:hypothetical protein